MNPAGSWSYMADVFGYERVANPDGGAIDSNPYAVFSAQGRKRIVADAGGNDLLQVNNGGQIKTLAVFPDLMVPYPPMFGGGVGPAQAVPTTVTQVPMARTTLASSPGSHSRRRCQCLSPGAARPAAGVC